MKRKYKEMINNDIYMNDDEVNESESFEQKQIEIKKQNNKKKKKKRKFIILRDDFDEGSENEQKKMKENVGLKKQKKQKLIDQQIHKDNNQINIIDPINNEDEYIVAQEEYQNNIYQEQKQQEIMDNQETLILHPIINNCKHTHPHQHFHKNQNQQSNNKTKKIINFINTQSQLLSSHSPTYSQYQLQQTGNQQYQSSYSSSPLSYSQQSYFQTPRRQIFRNFSQNYNNNQLINNNSQNQQIKQTVTSIFSFCPIPIPQQINNQYNFNNIVKNNMNNNYPQQFIPHSLTQSFNLKSKYSSPPRLMKNRKQQTFNQIEQNISNQSEQSESGEGQLKIGKKRNYEEMVTDQKSEISDEESKKNQQNEIQIQIQSKLLNRGRRRITIINDDNDTENENDEVKKEEQPQQIKSNMIDLNRIQLIKNRNLTIIWDDNESQQHQLKENIQINKQEKKNKQLKENNKKNKSISKKKIKQQIQIDKQIVQQKEDNEDQIQKQQKMNKQIYEDEQIIVAADENYQNVKTDNNIYKLNKKRRKNRQTQFKTNIINEQKEIEDKIDNNKDTKDEVIINNEQQTFKTPPKEQCNEDNREEDNQLHITRIHKSRKRLSVIQTNREENIYKDEIINKQNENEKEQKQQLDQYKEKEFNQLHQSIINHSHSQSTLQSQQQYNTPQIKNKKIINRDDNKYCELYDKNHSQSSYFYSQSNQISSNHSNNSTNIHSPTTQHSLISSIPTSSVIISSPFPSQALLPLLVSSIPLNPQLINQCIQITPRKERNFNQQIESSSTTQSQLSSSSLSPSSLSSSLSPKPKSQLIKSPNPFASFIHQSSSSNSSDIPIQNQKLLKRKQNFKQKGLQKLKQDNQQLANNQQNDENNFENNFNKYKYGNSIIDQQILNNNEKRTNNENNKLIEKHEDNDDNFKEILKMKLNESLKTKIIQDNEGELQQFVENKIKNEQKGSIATKQKYMSNTSSSFLDSSSFQSKSPHKQSLALAILSQFAQSSWIKGNQSKLVNRTILDNEMKNIKEIEDKQKQEKEKGSFLEFVKIELGKEKENEIENVIKQDINTESTNTESFIQTQDDNIEVDNFFQQFVADDLYDSNAQESSKKRKIKENIHKNSSKKVQNKKNIQSDKIKKGISLDENEDSSNVDEKNERINNQKKIKKLERKKNTKKEPLKTTLYITPDMIIEQNNSISLISSSSHTPRIIQPTHLRIANLFVTQIHSELQNENQINELNGINPQLALRFLFGSDISKNQERTNGRKQERKIIGQYSNPEPLWGLQSSEKSDIQGFK